MTALGGSFDLREATVSVESIIQTLAEDQASEKPELVGSSIAVIRAFHARFCNIPPFCSRREKDGPNASASS